MLTVAAVLHEADVSTVLSGKGFGAAAWVTFLGAGALVIRNSASVSKIDKRAGEPSSNSAGDESLPAE